ncbi:rRNA methyltransferase [Alkanindiges hydrocarboniclasticus]|jgi:TrmH family RNA methyltransferase|uniref:rRNA methyltransferase n=1 Tax=Alkanindiges hydrocarboniclasticus TaxID=1907941 RepID=A0A1S8CXS8_9GAMM|nr:RNA methyltransferase [Alkanindiges hydrocarboniclasticus]ONG41642.1 rRNA methyltransferase [Alkanindiges hydrocarboniclasticus]
MSLSFIDIQAKDNNKVKHLRGLCEQVSYRKKQQQTVLEGVHLIEAYLRTGQPIEAFYLTRQALENPEVQQLLDQNIHAPLYVLTESLYQDVRTLGPGIDIMAIIPTPRSPADINRYSDMLVLENLQDPGNVGTLLRTAAAAGIKQVICSKGTAAIWSPRVLRAGMGAQFSLTIFEHIALETFIPALSLPVYATSSHAQQSLYQLNLQNPCVWLMGNEGQGVSETLMQHAEGIAIPQPGGQESLNVAIAGAICLFEMVRQRLA